MKSKWLVVLGLVGAMASCSARESTKEAFALQSDAGLGLWHDLSAAVDALFDLDDGGADDVEARQLVADARARFHSKPPALAVNPVRQAPDFSARAWLDLRDDVAATSLRTESEELVPVLGAGFAASAVTRLSRNAQRGATLADAKSGLSFSTRLTDAQPVSARIVDGAAVYPRALGSQAHVITRATSDGAEDFVYLEGDPGFRSVRYTLDVSVGVAGLRLYANTLELLDADGYPRMHMAPPEAMQADGTVVPLIVTVDDCAADTSDVVPWVRPLVAPGSSSCTISLSWPTSTTYPLLVDPYWSTTGSVATARSNFATVSIPSVGTKGSVMIVGGYSVSSASPLSSVELYDVASGTWTSFSSLPTALGELAGVLASTYTVAVSGGSTSSYGGGTTNFYSYTFPTREGQIGSWISRTMIAARLEHTMTVMPSTGQLLICGGFNASSTTTNSCELWPTSLTSPAATGSLLSPVAYHTANVATANSALRVIVTGGFSSSTNAAVGTAEYFTGSAWTALPSITARYHHAAATLSDNTLLIAGGAADSTTPLRDAEVLPTSGPWTRYTTALQAGRQDLQAVTLFNGDAIIVSGETYFDNPPFSSWVNSPLVDRFNHTSKTFSAVGSLTTARNCFGLVSLTASTHQAIAISGNGTGTCELYLALDGSACTSSDMCVSDNCTSGTCIGSSCTTNADCGGSAGNAYCSSSVCVLKLANGTSATDPTTCQSGYASDGLCCNTSCSDACSSCSQPSTKGTCTPVPGGTACGSSHGSGVYMCIGSPPSCPSSCSDSTSCSPGNHCSATTCVAGTATGSACSANSDCATSLCSNGVCAALLPNGSGATSSDQCINSYADGVCCSGACGNACDRCDLPGSVGSCMPAPKDSTPTNGGCGGYLCDGSSTGCPGSPSCSTDSDCVGTDRCVSNVCTSRAALGGSCAMDDDCASGACAPTGPGTGACCDRACGASGNCETCSAATSWTCTLLTTGTCASSPPAPVTVLPATPSGGGGDIVTSSGGIIGPVQTDTDFSLDATRAAVVRGRVLVGGQPLAGIQVDVLGDENGSGTYGMYGRTITRQDGQWDLVVNGGANMTLRFQDTSAAPQYPSMDRTVFVRPSDYTVVPDVTMTVYEATSTAITMGASATQWYQGPNSGSRRTTLLFLPNSSATISGTAQTSITVSATELTAGTDPSVMQGDLPPTSGYTFASEFTVAQALASGADTDFTSGPLPIAYVENTDGTGNGYLGMPVGTTVPLGWLDRTVAQWKGAASGEVIKIAGVNAGVADVDTLQSGCPDESTGCTADNTGISSAERTALATLFSTGETLWRVQVPHFSGWDLNWGITLPDTAVAPAVQATSVVPSPKSCNSEGSIIDCNNLSLGERLPLAGLPWGLAYQSERQRGRIDGRQISIPLAGPSTGATVLSVHAEIQVAGQLHELSMPVSSTPYVFTWDGNDAYGRTVRGERVATVRLGYEYGPPNTVTPTYAITTFFGDSSAANITGGSSTLNSRASLVLWTDPYPVVVRNLDDQAVEQLGGWTLDVHHTYDPIGQVLYLGNGETRRALGSGNLIGSVSGSISDPVTLGANVLAAGADGTMYVSDSQHLQLRKFLRSGSEVTTGFPITEEYPGPLLVAADGSLMLAGQDVANHFVVQQISADGSTRSVLAGAGPVNSGCAATATTNPPPLSTEVNLCDSLLALALGSDGTLYLLEGESGYPSTRHVRRFTPDGHSTIFAGPGADATALQSVTLGTRMVVDATGTIVVDDGQGGLWKITPQGNLRQVMGQGSTAFWNASTTPVTPNDNMNASDEGGSSKIGNIGSMVAASDGSVYFTGNYDTWVIRLTPDEHLQLFAGTDISTSPAIQGDNGPAVGTNLASVQGLAWGISELLVLDEQASNSTAEIRRVYSPLPRSATGGYVIASEDGSLVYQFTESGFHQATLDARTNATLLTFVETEPGSGVLASINDFTNGGQELTTTLSHASGTYGDVTVTGPYGHVTTMHLDSNGYLSTVDYPTSSMTSLTTDPTGLLQSLTDENGKLHSFEFDSHGWLALDSDPTGGTQTLWSVSGDLTDTKRRSGLGNVYEHQVAVSGTIDTRVLTLPDPNLQKPVTTYYDNSRVVSTAMDGTQTQLTWQGSARFGVTAPVLASFTEANGANTVSIGVADTQTCTAALCDGTTPIPCAIDGRPLYQEITTTTVPSSASVSPGSHTSTWTNACTGSTVAPTRVESSDRGDGNLRKVSTSYDQYERPLSVAADGIYPVAFQYDGTGRLETVTQGTRSLTVGYTGGTGGGAGQLASISSPDSVSGTTSTVSFTSYDAMARLQTASATQSTTRTVTAAYDAAGNMTTLEVPTSQTHTFGHDALDRVGKYQPPQVSTESGYDLTYFNYDADRHLAEVARPDGDNITLTRDVTGRVTLANHPVRSLTFNYETGTGNYGRLLSVTDGSEQVSYTYPSTGSLPTNVNWSGVTGGGVYFGYDGALRLAYEDINGSSTSLHAAYAYDFDNLITQVVIGSSAPTTFALTRDPNTGYGTGQHYNGLLWTTALGSGANTISDARTYNGYGELASYAATRGSTTAYTVTYDDLASNPRDSYGRVIKTVETMNASTTTLGASTLSTTRGYTYTDGRLTNVSDSTGATEAYTYDPNGNRLTATFGTGGCTGSAATGTYTSYDAQDRMVSYGCSSANQQTFTYRKNGDRLTKTVGGATTTYAYDAFGNLLSVVPSSGSRIDYVIDGVGRRVGRKVAGTLQTEYLWDGKLRVVATSNASGTIQQRYVYATSVNSPDLVIDSSGTVYRVIKDQLGSVRMVVGLDGTIKEKHSYDAFGNELPSPAFVASGWTQIPFGFAGGLYDSQTGLYRFGARDYDPIVGRWLSKDSEGFHGGTSNVFEYSASDPVNFRDANGRWVDSIAPENIPLLQQAFHDSPFITGSLLAILAFSDVHFQLNSSAPGYEARLGDDGGGDTDAQPDPATHVCRITVSKDMVNAVDYIRGTNNGLYLPGVLIHEMIHGAQVAFGIPYDGKNGANQSQAIYWENIARANAGVPLR